MHAVSRERTVARILKAAERVFGRRGFDGATTSEIAKEAGVSKATVHYYFKTKHDLYAGVLDRILAVWSEALNEIRIDRDPLEAFNQYIARKIEYAQKYPELTRLWAIEVLSGAKRIRPFLQDTSREILKEKGAIVRHWIDSGKMDAVDPTHLFFMIWAVTQTYAEAESQMTMIVGKDVLHDRAMQAAKRTISHIVLKGLGLAT